MTFEVHEARLDTADLLERADPLGMLRAIATSAAQVRESSALAREVDLSDIRDGGRPRALVVVGMGGSAIAGDALTALAGIASPMPIVTLRSYELPGWVGAADLVVGVSCSGSTEETLTVMVEALRRGCRLAGVGAAGSQLHDTVERSRGPFIAVSAGGRQPRANMWALTLPLLFIAQAAGALTVSPHDIEATAARLTEVSQTSRPASESFVNPAKSFALQLAGSLPVVWGGSPVAAVAAYRWQTQFAENAKYPLISGTVPEANHNQVVTLDGPFAGSAPVDIFADPEDGAPESTRLRLILLRDPTEHARVALRMDASRELADERGIPVTEITADGDSDLERLASLVAYGDYVSTYLAIALGIDPTPVATITALKTRIALR
ncbi:MAG: glucose/mannose-6-phosphate isomerase [Frankiaceae bacterium]|nr:glucose/mannose-6-phosphate isomerase [Frankiaceae bacterium]